MLDYFRFHVASTGSAFPDVPACDISNVFADHPWPHVPIPLAKEGSAARATGGVSSRPGLHGSWALGEPPTRSHPQGLWCHGSDDPDPVTESPAVEAVKRKIYLHLNTPLKPRVYI